MTTITQTATVIVDIPTEEYSHNDAAEIFEHLRSEMFGTNAVKEHRLEDLNEWEGSFLLSAPFDSEEFSEIRESYGDRYPGVEITLQPELENLLR